MTFRLKSFALPFALVLSGFGTALHAAEMNVTVNIPRLQVAEYHRPYVAIWVEGEDRSVAANLSHWYDLKMKDKEGEKWLKDMRQWWRRSGRGLEFPIDGISAATRAPGDHTLTFTGGKAPLGELAPGNYKLMVEAAREVGGRELLEIPFQWPPQAAQKLDAQGSSELGTVALELKP